ncbi:MAG: (2Fe-2S)-binding protein [Oceanospirillaceae bacterium]|jgi:bacterioferritin-associated ferredoxin|uniref:(2Fe-2S)-binding protein n=1 Tax=Marinobacterium litorale TaxID=404770 RepID=UPI000403E930|nr:(2Fe-2S)-binding protein [Marinobacterium litorale]MBS99597.1 (2Fe-2S)-binding protein [Oceanospirillaceae bacterium]
MYVCICNNITERQVREAIDDGARSVRDLNRSLSVGSECGKCTCVARKILKREQQEQAMELAVPA